MARWDSADLLARFQEECLRPANETGSEAFIARAYRYLSDAQSEWITTIAAVAPESQMGAPTQMVSTDEGYTYEFRDANGETVFPIGHAEVRASRSGALLMPTFDASGVGDYVPEGNRIRIPNGQTRAFPDGPWARFVAPGGTIDADTEPTLQPPHARILIVYRALAKWARRGGMRDPQPYLDMENEAWLGAPNAGVHGILGALRTQHAHAGARLAVDPGAWWRGNPDLGRAG